MNKKRLFRSFIMTLLLVGYLFIFNTYLDVAKFSLVIMVVGCFILDYSVRKIMKTKKFHRFFY